MALKPAHLQWSDDGALRSLDFEDIYFQPGRGPEESDYVFLEQNRLPARFLAPPAEGFRIAELGFGTGLNFLLTAALWRRTAPATARLTYVSIEKHPVSVSDLRRVFSFWPQLRAASDSLLELYPPLVEGFHHLRFFDDRVRLVLAFGDVADVLPEISGRFDAWYLDGFSPARNPGMWEETLFPLISARTKPGGTLSTFSSAGAVRRGLESAGLHVKKVRGFGVKRDMTVATMPGSALPGNEARGSVTVLGAGIAGASAAYALAQKGYAVTVVDRHPAPAYETSGNPVGIVYPKMTVDPSPAGIFHRHGFCFTRNLAQALGLPSWRPCGVTHLDISAEDAKRHQALAAQGYPEDFLRYENGLYLPMAGYLSPPELCRRLLGHPNIETRYSTTVSVLDATDASATVVALGHGAKSFPQTEWLPLQSLRGQITYLKPTPQSERITRVYCHDGYITPAIDGLHYIGATFQKEEPASPDVRAEDHLENLSMLNRHMPELVFTDAHVAGGRAGYRTTTPDKLPLVGRCPDYPAFVQSFSELRAGRKVAAEGGFIDSLYLSTGFGAHGLTGAPLAGEIVACMIAGDPLPVPESLMGYLGPERFILRDLKRRKI